VLRLSQILRAGFQSDVSSPATRRLERLQSVLDGIPVDPEEIVVVDIGSNNRPGEILGRECARDTMPSGEHYFVASNFAATARISTQNNASKFVAAMSLDSHHQG
jgi:hypothetical protein